MKPSQFDSDVLDVLAQRVPSYPSLDLYHAYGDVLLMSEEIRAHEATRPADRALEAASTEADPSEAFRQDRLITVLLKSLYMVTDCFFGRFLGALHGRESMTMNSFLATGAEKFAGIEEGALQGAYCLAIYRNKLVAHYDRRRLGGYSTDAAGNRRLTPMPESFHISELDLAELQELQTKYQSALPELSGIENHFKLLTYLFYSLPVGRVQALNPDRPTINRIAENGGCDSRSAAEVLNAVDRFCLAVAQL